MIRQKIEKAIAFSQKHVRALILGVSLGLPLSLISIITLDIIDDTRAMKARIASVRTDMATVRTQVADINRRLDNIEAGLAKQALDLELFKQQVVNYVRQYQAQQAAQQQTVIAPKVVKTRSYKRPPQKAAAGS